MMDNDEQMLAPDEASRNAGRKRSLDDDSPSTLPPTVRKLTLNDQELPAFKSLSLEAIFHPKFENENRNDQSIRSEMKERVLADKGYIEVSLKHSGSLLLWSGGQRYYSKNSTDNPFTYVGEVLLRQHFYRAYSNEECMTDDNMERRYQECSDYVQEHRLTLAFEVVTAILGHHGDIPARDFMILTAIADRNTERFYSTCQLIQLAQRFRLPHNDTWVFDSEQSVDGLFHLYDTTREIGLAEDTVAALNDIADMHVSSMYPHTVFQGNILEGIVIRYVPFHDKKEEEETLKILATASQRILTMVPPETPPAFVLTKGLAKAPPVLTTDIRDLSKVLMASGNHGDVMTFLESAVSGILSSSDKNNCRRSVERNVDLKPATFPSFLQQTFANQEIDEETKRLLKLIETLDGLKAKVVYHIVKESMNAQPDRWLCIVQVIHDTTHQKFRRRMGTNDMNLFRGFCIELNTDPKEARMTIETAGGDVSPPSDDGSSGLMLKMKFLPYMVRTFGCRNGLQVVVDSGPMAFTEYTMKLMTRWGMSAEAKTKWQPFFRAWGKYAHKCLTEKDSEYSNTQLPKLCDAYYLEHLEYFTKLYESGEIVGDSVEDSESSLRGLLFVVGLDKERANVAAETISERLGGITVRKGLNALAQEDWEVACLTRRRGIICSVSVDTGTKSVRQRLKDYGEAMCGVLVGCDEVAIASYCERMKTTSEEETSKKFNPKKLKGQATSWRRTGFTKVYEISDFDFDNNSKVVEDGNEDATMKDGSALDKIVNDLIKTSASVPKRDERPGLLVFFPGIPGSGKSTLCVNEMEADLCRMINEAAESKAKIEDAYHLAPPRKVIVLVSDEVKKKYWPLVKVEKTKTPSSVLIADKNAPPAGWTNVVQACSAGKSIAVPVLPDTTALRTTLVKGADQYPFSLHYLAVCMSRVMTRPPESHAGKLDRATDLACMVVVKFYSFYRGIAAEELLPSIQGTLKRGGVKMSCEPVTVPFFAQQDLPSLPAELSDALNDALRIQVSPLVVCCQIVSVSSTPLTVFTFTSIV